MSDQWTTWLHAYIDGELAEDRIVELDGRLQECANCRKDLQELLALRELLQACPVAERAGSDADFVRTVVRQLPAQRTAALLPSQDIFRVAWRALPFSLAGLLAVGQAVLIVSGLLWLGLRVGLLDSSLLAALVTGAAPSGGLTSAIGGVLASDMWDGVGVVLGTVGPLALIGFGYFVVLCGFGLLYWSWLASWWLRRNRKSLATTEL